MYSTATSQPAQSIPPFSPLLVRLRAVLLGALLFLYIWLGPQRNFPPFIPALPLMLVALLTCWWLWKVWRRERLVRSPLALPFVALLGAATISTAFSIDQRMSVEGLQIIAVQVLAFFVVCDLLLAGWSATTFVSAMLIGVLFVLLQGLWAIASWFTSWYMLRVPEYPLFPLSLRLFGIAEHPNLLAAMINLSLPFAIVALGLAGKRVMRVSYGTWIVIAEVVLFFTRSRTGWVATATVVSVAVGWLIARRVRSDSFGPAPITARRLVAGSWRICVVAACYVALFAFLYVTNNQLTTSDYSSNAGLSHRTEAILRAVNTFLVHPITGSGLLTFGRISVDTSLTTRNWIDPHPHSVFFDLLSQQGIFGIAAFIWLVAAGAVTLAGGWLRGLQDTRETEATPDSDGRMALIVAASASLLGYLVHGLLDVPHWSTANALIIVVICAIGMASAEALRRSDRSLARWTVLALVVPLGLAFVLMRQGAAQNAMLSGIVSGMRGDWGSAASAMDEARRLDPNFTYYISQQGYAYGMLAETNNGSSGEGALDKALQSYSEARTHEPSYVVILLNQAALLETADRDQDAQTVLEDALARGLDWPLIAILLGDRANQMGNQARAETLFAIAMRYDAQSREIAACRRSLACQSAGQRLETPNPIFQIHRQAHELLAQKQPQQALDLLSSIKLSDANPQPWLDRADAYLALGDIPHARYALEMANVLRTTIPVEPGEVALTTAALKLQHGDRQGAIEALEKVVRPQINQSQYDFAVFWRLGLPGLLLPSIDRLQRTDSDLQVYQELADLYAATGRTDDATWAQRQSDALAALLRQ